MFDETCVGDAKEWQKLDFMSTCNSVTPPLSTNLVKQHDIKTAPQLFAGVHSRLTLA
jgi:hypothetical protein